MILQYSNKRDLVVDCPNCRRQSLVLVTTTMKTKSEDLLACKSCKMAIFVQDLKKQLFPVYNGGINMPHVVFDKRLDLENFSKQFKVIGLKEPYFIKLME